MKIRAFTGGGFSSNCYLLFDDAEQCAIAVDPSIPFDEVKSELPKSLSIEAILLTHAHADHVLFLDDWRKKTGAPVLIGKGDGDALSDPDRNCALYLGLGAARYGTADRLLSEGEQIALGDERLTVLSTPGHSPGSICISCKGDLISGDTLFAYGGVGRTDFIGGSAPTLAASLRRLLSLPGNTVVYPGHGPSTTVEEERIRHYRLFN